MKNMHISREIEEMHALKNLIEIRKLCTFKMNDLEGYSNIFQIPYN
jgi:hypothetical protein